MGTVGGRGATRRWCSASPPSTESTSTASRGPGAAGGGRNEAGVPRAGHGIAAEHGIDLDRVEGTGRGGRVRKQDVLALVESGEEPPLHIESPYRPEPAASAPAAAPVAGGLSRMRRQIGEHMKRSLET